ncbi:hypothetical protein PSN45_005279 [Yamadazyma tenuis]|uniref:CBM21 domain-containing protein n=1 Tax=Candida tenuis (strain ATCC 10573 / BCRC 21748 / CBS 615 / JCM 9827 / NBRC 10315 / NRRL Y-1498 / VKM Y-70) TaxID=590646 RepID=G3B1A7_CANTC|nr:uncharacterized protein CANTEDRAFT_134230 [Yamadazyma tenuis ATCC 10573]EGV64925.1 hypothetical protein CANTEDRAFT_134230 [Yamadazyma tenuis ATCC 10573]WEJ97720.1 hypothetical protein PSN45_005279 [Yamadazyma tenuis]
MLIRKKSGEILKSSLKSRPALTKNVSFNNFLDIKTFDGTQSPSSISRKNSPNQSPSDSPFNSPNPFYADPNPQYQYFIKSHNINTSATSHNPVHLKSINYYDNKLVGYFYCLNLGYEKSFQLKLTFNHWQTSILFNSNFKYTRSVGDYDEFKFEMPLNVTKDFEFVLSYKVNNQIYWDNNNRSNYKVTVSSALQHHDLDRHVFDLNYDIDYDYNTEVSEKSSTEGGYLDTEYVDSLLNKFISTDYKTILQNYCFHGEPSQSYFSLSDEISI